MKIFLTGGAGFIGRNIIEQLGGTYDILAPTHAELDLTDSDAVLGFLKDNPVDAVVNAANIGGTRKQQHVFGISHINLKIFFNLVRSRKYFKRLINLGSGAEYGKQQNLARVSEDFFDTKVPSDEYGLYKYVCSKYAAEVDFITQLRLFAVFGKYEDYEIRFISNAICKALLGLPITMRQNVIFDYLFIDDFIKILDKIIRNKPSETSINVCRGEGVELLALAKKVIEEIGAGVPIHLANPGFGYEYTGDNSLMLKEIKKFDFTPIDTAIGKLVSYYRSILPTLNKKSFLTDI